jgi:pantoate kinase
LWPFSEVVQLIDDVRSRGKSGSLNENMRLPKMPTRDQFLAEAKDMFKETGSLDDIVDRAYELLHKSVGSLLVVPAQWATADPTSA